MNVWIEDEVGCQKTDAGGRTLSLDPMGSEVGRLSEVHEVAAILRERGWLRAAPQAVGELSAGVQAWIAEAVALLGPQCTTREELAELLARVFEYDARALMQQPETHVVIVREGARAVIRELAGLVLEGGAVDSQRFKEIVTALKERLPYRGRELFHPLRLVLAGRAGEGDLDRVALLLDGAAEAGFEVKACRERVLEFCSAMR